VHEGIGALPDGIGLCPLVTVPPPCPALVGTVARSQSPIPLGGQSPIPLVALRLCGGIVRILARRPCGGVVRILRRLSEPPGGRRWPPEGGSASLEAMGGGVDDGIGVLPDGIRLFPLATVLARAGHCGGTVELE